MVRWGGLGCLSRLPRFLLPRVHKYLVGRSVQLNLVCEPIDIIMVEKMHSFLRVESLQAVYVWDLGESRSFCQIGGIDPWVLQASLLRCKRLH